MKLEKNFQKIGGMVIVIGDILLLQMIVFNILFSVF